MQTRLLSAQCISVNIPILACESKIQTQTLTVSVINQVMHHYQGVVKGMGPEPGEVLTTALLCHSYLKSHLLIVINLGSIKRMRHLS